MRDYITLTIYTKDLRKIIIYNIYNLLSELYKVVRDSFTLLDL